MGEADTLPSSGAGFLVGGGRMGRLMREHDWAATPLGPPAQWPRSLKTAVRIVLTCRQPMFVWWGPQLVNLYNDAYIGVLGGKHPSALGRSAPATWREIWPAVGPRAEHVLQYDEGTFDESLLLVMERHGFPEETYYTFSYSPVRDDAGAVGGLLCACTEDTRRIHGERQMALLRELGAATAHAPSVEAATRATVDALAGEPRDLPFALLYLADADGGRLTLAGSTGLAGDHPCAPARLPCSASRPWPVAEVLAARQPVLVDDLSARFEALPCGAWQRPPHQAEVLPLGSSGEGGQAGVLVVGLNPHRRADEGYRGFLRLVAGQISAGLAHARAYEGERRRAQALAELDRAKTAFFSNVSHEFRTPLALVLGPLDEVLERTSALPGSERELLVIARRNGQRLLRLVNTLLDFSRIEAGRVAACFEPLDLAQLTTGLASVFRSTVERAGVRLLVDCPPLREPVWADRDMWEKIVLNLVSNAFKYTLEGEIRVELREAGGAAVLTVTDTGIGIPEHELPRVFERFHRVAGARGRTQEGSGIGLALVAELAKLHGGRVEVRSVEGEGSSFSVSIPLGRAHLPDEQVEGGPRLASTALGAAPFVEEALRWLPEPAGDSRVGHAREEAGEHGVPEGGAEHNAAPPADGRRSRIVLADDNADMRAYVRRLLAAAGHDVVAVSDGRQALQEVRRGRADLLLADVMMPQLDGLQLLAALRADERTAEVPVVLLSARAGEEARIEGLQAGADDYVVKPFGARELLARVGGTLALAETRRAAREALAESEDRFRNLADQAPVMVWVAGEDGRCTYRARSWTAFTGQPPEDALDLGWLDAVHPDDRPATRRVYLDAVARRQPFQLDYRLRHHGGVHRWVIDAAVPRRDGGGRFVGFVGSAVDITERKQAEEALVEADRRKDEFLATLAHELRNPLAPLQNGLAVLGLLGDDRRAQERTRAMMERQLKQLVRLVDDLLDVSRISRGYIELREERLDVRAVLRAALETVRPLVAEREHELVADLAEVALPVCGDPVRLAQVFGNLLNNAARYTEPGGHLELCARRQGDSAVVTVRDDGTGIPSDMLERVFGMFTQVPREGGAAIAPGGLGIGLSLVQQLVRLHGGRVQATSEGLGCGSEFVVELPLLPEEGPASLAGEPARASRAPVENMAAAQARGVEAGTTESEMAGTNEGSGTAGTVGKVGGPEGGGAEAGPGEASPREPRDGRTARRIVVADDNVDAAVALATMLQILGHEVAVAHDGQQAVELADALRPDLVVLDIGMPRLNGYEAARLLRQREWARHAVLVALTGWGQSEDKRRSHEAGFDHHLVKPADLPTLQSLLAGAGGGGR